MADIIVESGVTSTGQTLTAQNMIVLAGGLADTTTLNTEAGLFVSSGGSAKMTTVNKREVTLESGSADKVYDGTPLTCDTVTVGGDGFIDGEGATYSVTGSQTEKGTSPNSFTYTLTPTTKASNYTITQTYGELDVHGILLTVTADSITRSYDGTKLTGGYSYEGDLKAGDELVVTVSGSITNAGSTQNKITSSRVMRGTVDVTGEYDIKTFDGTLTVEKRNVTLESGSARKYYDGTPLTCNTVTVKGDGFIDGEGATYTVTGSQTEVGKSDNTFEFKLNSGTKSGNYNITKQYGELYVSDHPLLSITADSAARRYDGSALTAGYSYTGQLFDGDTLVVKTSGSQTDVGSAVNHIESVKVMRGSEDVTNLYEFTDFVDGTLTVTRREVTITSGSVTRYDDGSTLTDDTITIDGNGFADGEGATYSVTGSQTGAGSSKNTFTYSLDANTKASNYDITCVEGDLTLLPDTRPVITITADSATRVYNGKELTAGSYSLEGDLIAGDKLYAAVDGSITDVGSGTNVVSEVVIMRGKQDVTEEYRVQTVNGTLTVERAAITLCSADASRAYNGKELTAGKVAISGGRLASGDKIVYSNFASITDVGSCDNTFTYCAGNAQTDLGNYLISIDYGTLCITYGSNYTIDGQEITFDEDLDFKKLTIKNQGALKIENECNLRAKSLVLQDGSIQGGTVNLRADKLTVSGADNTVSRDASVSKLTVNSGKQDNTTGVSFDGMLIMKGQGDKFTIGNWCDFSAQALLETSGNDTLKFGNNTEARIYRIDFVGGKDTLTVGNDCDVTLIADDASSLNKFTIGKNSVAWLSKALADSSKLKLGKNSIVYEIEDELSDNTFATARTLELGEEIPEADYDGVLGGGVDRIDFFDTGDFKSLAAYVGSDLEIRLWSDETTSVKWTGSAMDISPYAKFSVSLADDADRSATHSYHLNAKLSVATDTDDSDKYHYHLLLA